jgi:hypothetical protein
MFCTVLYNRKVLPCVLSGYLRAVLRTLSTFQQNHHKQSGKGLKERTYFYRAPEYGLLPGKLPEARGYLGGENLMGYEDNKAYFRRKLTSDSLLRDSGSVCSDFSLLLVIGGMEKNPEPGAEVEKILQVVCSGCDRNLKSGTQCNTCGRWSHNRCGNVKAQVAESGKWTCDKCRSERV